MMLAQHGSVQHETCESAFEHNAWDVMPNTADGQICKALLVSQCNFPLAALDAVE